MSVFEHWQAQRDSLRTALSSCTETADVVYQIRHALLQTEQNALAAMDDDILRQQAGILLGCLKNAAGLLEANVQTQVWVPQSLKKKAKRRKSETLVWISGSLVALLSAFCYLKGQWLGFSLGFGAIVLFCAGMLLARRETPFRESREEVRVTLKPDVDRLFSVLDGQVRTIDRYLNDLGYLNDQLRESSETGDPVSLSRVADLMESLYECDGEARLALDEPVKRLLDSLGLCVLDYSAENRRYFNALPSKSVTRTLSPAILSAKDRQLLRRGTAAVQIDVA